MDGLLEEGFSESTAHSRACVLRRLLHYAGIPLGENPAHAVLADGYSRRIANPFRDGIVQPPGVVRNSLKRHRKKHISPGPAAAEASYRAAGTVLDNGAPGGSRMVQCSGQDFCELWLALGIELQEGFRSGCLAVTISVWRGYP
jgi:hypothetical protein